VSTEQLDTEVIEMVAGALRPLRRAAELAWMPAYESGPRSSRQLLAVGIDSLAGEASSLLPRRARSEGPTPVGQNPAELLAPAERLLNQTCLECAQSRLPSLRTLVGELIWEARTRSSGDRPTVDEPPADRAAVSLETLLDMSTAMRTWATPSRMPVDTLNHWRFGIEPAGYRLGQHVPDEPAGVGTWLNEHPS
jgi:hypothetical protein